MTEQGDTDPASQVPTHEDPTDPEPTSSPSDAGGRGNGIAAVLIQFLRFRYADRRDRRGLAKDERRDANRKREARPSLSERFTAWRVKSMAGLKRAMGNVAFLMALIGSGFGQTMWWASQTGAPIWFVLSFAITLECGMVGADAEATRRRRMHRSATTLRLVSWSLAAFATGSQVAHFSVDGVVARFGETEIQGSPQLGIGFGLITLSGFLIRTLSENARVNDALLDDGYIRPLGAARWLNFPRVAWATRRLLIDQPHLDVEEAWQQCRRRRGSRTSWTSRAAYMLGRRRGVQEHSASVRARAQTSPPVPDAVGELPPSTVEIEQPAPAQALVSPAKTEAPSGDVPSRQTRSSTPHSASTDAGPDDSEWLEKLRPAAEHMVECDDWFSQNNIRAITGDLSNTEGVGKGRAKRLLAMLEEHFPQHRPNPIENREDHRRNLLLATDKAKGGVTLAAVSSFG